VRKWQNWIAGGLIVCALPMGILGVTAPLWPADRIVPDDLAPRELREVPVGGLFRHDGETWARLAPDPDRLDENDRRPRALAARLTGPDEGRGVAVVLFARCWVRPVRVEAERVREVWE
jgi:hypothetical protein